MVLLRPGFDGPRPNLSYSRAWRWLLHRFPKLNELRYRATELQYGLFTTTVVRSGWQRSLIQAASPAWS